MDNEILKNAKIITISLFITKVLGIIYIIPFYAMLSEKYIALYGMMYAIYALFTQLATVGIPVGVSKLVSKFNSEHNYKMTNLTYVYALRFAIPLGIVSFVALYFYAPIQANISNLNGSISPDEMTTALRIIAVTLLILPILSITRGYIQGHEMMSPTSKSIVIEQIVRIGFVLVCVYFITQILDVSEKYAIYSTSVASIIAALIAYIVIVPPLKKLYSSNKKASSIEKIYSFKSVMLSIATISIPFILIGVSKNIYEVIDSSTITYILSKFELTAEETLTITSVNIFNVTKLAMIVLTFSSGFSMTIIPTITKLYSQNRDVELKDRITQITLLTLFTTGFVSLFSAIFSAEIYYMFFGYSEIGVSVFTFNILTITLLSVIMVLATCLISIDRPFLAGWSLLVGIIFKIIAIPITNMIFVAFDFPPQYIFSTTTLIGFLASCVVLFIYVQKYHFLLIRKFSRISMKIVVSLILSGIIMLILNVILVRIIDVSQVSGSVVNRLICLVIVMVFGLISLITYIKIASIFKYLEYVSGINYLEIKGRIKNAFR